MSDTHLDPDYVPWYTYARYITCLLLGMTGLFLGGQTTHWADPQFGWPRWAYPLCAAGGMTLAWLIIWPRSWLAVLIAAPIAGAGGWFATNTFLAHVDSYFTPTPVLIYCLGTAPGILLFLGVLYILMRCTNYKLFTEDREEN